MRRTTLFLAAVLVGAAGIPGFRLLQTAIRGRTAPLFPTVCPHPTGRNGYEELVKAVDLWSASPACQAYEGAYDEPAGAPVDATRRALADSGVRRVLAMIRAGLAKPIHSPRTESSLTDCLPDLRDFRALARLLRGQMELHLAEGHPARAVDCLEESLAFARAIRAEGMTSGVVGLYAENVLMRAFTRHLDQLEPLDAAGFDRIIAIEDRHLRPPDPQIALITWDRDMLLRDLRTHRSNAAGLLATLDPGPNVTQEVRENYADVCRIVRHDPASGPATFDQAADLARAHFGRTLAELARPAWERRYPEAVERESTAAKLIFSLYPFSFARIGERFAATGARAGILAAHAAVMRYRKDRARLPSSLAELNLGSLADDPFTGQTLDYRMLGPNSYSISSVGPHDPGDSKRPASGQRVPIVVTYPPTRDQ